MGGEEILTDQVGGVEFAVGQCPVDIAVSLHATGATACPELATRPRTPSSLACRPPVNSHEGDGPLRI